MKIGVQISFALGLGVLIALIATQGAGAIASLLAGAGWKLILLVPLQTLPLLLDVLGWRSVILGRVRLPALFLIACIRQAINRLLPVANVGVELVGLRLLVQQGVDGASAGASIGITLASGEPRGTRMPESLWSSERSRPSLVSASITV